MALFASYNLHSTPVLGYVCAYARSLELTRKYRSTQYKGVTDFLKLRISTLSDTRVFEIRVKSEVNIEIFGERIMKDGIISEDLKHTNTHTHTHTHTHTF